MIRWFNGWAPTGRRLRKPLISASAFLMLFAAGEQGAHFEAYDPNALLQRRNLLTDSDAMSGATGTGGAPPTLSNVAGTLPTGVSSNVRQVVWAGAGDTRLRVQVTNADSSAVYKGSVYYSTTSANGPWTRLADQPVIFSGTTAICDFSPAAIGSGYGATAWICSGQIEKGPASTAYQMVTDWNTEYLAAAAAQIGMYQDSAGTTPVTAVEQPVGLWLDKKQGLVRGAELVSSMSIAAGRNANSTVDAQSASSITVRSVAAGTYGTHFPTVAPGAGKQLWMALTVTSSTTRSLSVNCGGANRSITLTAGVPMVLSSLYLGLTTTTNVLDLFISAAAADETLTLSAVSLKELPGNHATQATAPARPKASALVNRLLSTHTYAGASWTRRGAAAVGGPAPDGTGELLSIGLAAVDDIFQASVSGAGMAGVPHVPRVEIWPVSTTGTLTIANPSGGAEGRWFVNLALLTQGAWNTISASHPAVTVSAAFVASATGTMGHHYHALSRRRDSELLRALPRHSPRCRRCPEHPRLPAGEHRHRLRHGGLPDWRQLRRRGRQPDGCVWWQCERVGLRVLLLRGGASQWRLGNDPHHVRRPNGHFWPSRFR
jgi:hypothetical protein